MLLSLVTNSASYVVHKVQVQKHLYDQVPSLPMFVVLYAPTSLQMPDVKVLACESEVHFFFFL